MSILSDVIPALRALLVSLAGVGLALWWFRGQWLAGIGLVVAIGLVGVLMEQIGDRCLLPSYPVAAVLVMEWWILAPMSIGAAASALVIVVAVTLTVPESVTDPVLKETTSSLATALSTFLTAAFISSIGDRDRSAVGDRIKERMRCHYTRAASTSRCVLQVPAEGAVEMFLHSDLYKGLSGWDRETRIARARGIAEELTKGVNA